MDGIMKKLNPAKSIVFGIFILILLYFIYLVAFNVPVTYTIDIGSKGDTDSRNDAYMGDLTSKGEITQRMSIEDDTFRNMTGTYVYFHITPRNQISSHTKITAELTFKGDSDLDIGVYRNFEWKPLYVRSIENYTLIERLKDASIYARDNSSIYGIYETNDNVEEWIQDNIPKYSSIGSYNYQIDPEILKNRDLKYENGYTEINQTFRGTHSFLLYLKDTLNLTISKQDLNLYNGSDEYSIELYDDQGTLIYDNIMRDDGIIDNSGTVMPLHIERYSGTGIKEGLYVLNVVTMNGENKDVDSSITKIQINTDKIMTTGDIMLLSPTTLYFELDRNTTININARQEQDINIRGTVEKDVSISNELSKKWMRVELPKGSYTMSVPGDLYVSGANFAFTGDSIFHPYDYELSNENSDWMIVSNYQVEKNDRGWITAKNVFMGSELELQDNKTIIFGVRKKDNRQVRLGEFKVILTPR